MAIVIRGGDVKAGDAIAVEFPAGERRALLPV
jgi:MOSC domain-containing protein YiiM